MEAADPGPAPALRHNVAGLAYCSDNLYCISLNQKMSAMSDQPAEDFRILAALCVLAAVLAVLVIGVLGAFILNGPLASHALFLSG